MNNILESVFLISAGLGFLLSVALMTDLFRPNKANFFLGIIIFFLSIQLLFSWGSYSGYNNSSGNFPFWIFLTYNVLPPSVYLFTRHQLNTRVKLRSWYAILYLPALAEILITVFIKLGIIFYPADLMEYQVWIWFIDYIPMIGFIISLGYFWRKYGKARKNNELKLEKDNWIYHLNLMLLMGVLTIIGLLWLAFSLIGWEKFSIIEFLLVFLLFVFSFLRFLNSNSNLMMTVKSREDAFPNYNDQEELKRLKDVMDVKQLFINPDLSLIELSKELGLPSRYLSYLINRYHHKSYKEFLNQYRIDAFIAKAQSDEIKNKTLLGLAMESGFNSKSTFNQAFKNYKGKSPSEYLK
ncbi:helix-turn-helix domain-containing protein [Anditalea andensis]|uniref:HTH araC/xylS-type domain-containing protein n=1 Tax=Anditalea andensis TaxID=1048983 RepID=A0A074KUA5_9BACT|nr:helix-turn-helix domain-containing protein [Anditalea andensis]KEO71850.1 hypothetical protein EL17_21070 [Anditalea andensis]